MVNSAIQRPPCSAHCHYCTPCTTRAQLWLKLPPPHSARWCFCAALRLHCTCSRCGAQIHSPWHVRAYIGATLRLSRHVHAWLYPGGGSHSAHLALVIPYRQLPNLPVTIPCLWCGRCLWLAYVPLAVHRGTTRPSLAFAQQPRQKNPQSTCRWADQHLT